ncbi:hypothetical protein YC2023_046133 [Brassica napus]
MVAAKLKNTGGSKFLEFNILRKQKLRSPSSEDVTATAVLPPNDSCGGSVFIDPSPRFHDLDMFFGLTGVNVSSGAFIGICEALELMDGGKEYLGKGVSISLIQWYPCCAQSWGHCQWHSSYKAKVGEQKGQQRLEY